MILLSKPVAAAPYNIGAAAAGGSSGGFSGMTAVRVNNPKSGTLQSVGIFWQANPGSISFLLGVYADNSGVPGSLLATSALSTTAIGSPQTLTMTTNPVLAAGNYWLATQQQSTVNGFYDSVGLGYFNSSQAWTGSLPATASGGSTGAFTFSLNATLIG